MKRELLGLFPLVLFACSGGTELVKMAPLPPSKRAPLRVGFPPPPAKIEYVPLRRGEDCRYRDGYYHHDGRGWVWVPGAWVIPPKNCAYSRPVTRYETTDVGQVLVYREGGFFGIEKPFAPCPAAQECGSSAESPTTDGKSEAPKPSP